MGGGFEDLLLLSRGARQAITRKFIVQVIDFDSTALVTAW